MSTSLRLLTLMLAGAASGCLSFSGHFGAPIHEERLADIETGVTTREQVTEWFGPPSAFFQPSLLDLIFQSEDEINQPVAPVLEDVYTWRYIETRMKMLFLPVLFLWADASSEATTLTVFFDEKGVVRYHAFRRDGSDAGNEEGSP